MIENQGCSINCSVREEVQTMMIFESLRIIINHYYYLNHSEQFLTIAQEHRESFQHFAEEHQGPYWHACGVGRFWAEDVGLGISCSPAGHSQTGRVK